MNEAIAGSGRDDSAGPPLYGPLYGRMMVAIRKGHSFGNSVRMLKLPLIFCEAELYAGAIAQFYLLSSALEDALDAHAAHPMVAKVRGMGLRVTPGYAADLEELLGEGWKARAEQSQTSATKSYVAEIKGASPVELTAAAFILYGALVVGGGKSTQAKVRKVFPQCKHALFDVAEDIKAARAQFKTTFNAIGRESPEHFAVLEEEAVRFMGLNNTVVLSIPCLGRRAASVGLAVGVGLSSALLFALFYSRRR